MANKKKGKAANVDTAQKVNVPATVNAPVNESTLSVDVDESTLSVGNTAKDRLAAAVMTIKRSQAQLRVNQFTIAITLKKVYDEELFKAGGFKNVYDFAQAEFDYKKASTNNMIRIANAFLDASDENKIKTIFAKGDIDFKFSQLAEMLSLPVESAKNLVDTGRITANTPVKEIRDIVKGIKSQDKQEKSDADNATADNAVNEQSDNGEVNTAKSLESRQNAIDAESEIESLKKQIAELQEKYETACKIGNAIAANNEKLRKSNYELREELKKQKSENGRLHKKLQAVNADDKPVWLSNVRH